MLQPPLPKFLVTKSLKLRELKIGRATESLSLRHSDRARALAPSWPIGFSLSTRKTAR
jgi:hypothetical protein